MTPLYVLIKRNAMLEFYKKQRKLVELRNDLIRKANDKLE